jgi:hypothetical protein
MKFADVNTGSPAGVPGMRKIYREAINLPVSG